MRDRVALYCALLSGICAAGWMWAVALDSFQGNWTGFYRTGTLTELPPVAAQEHIYVDSALDHGYDGQFYRMIAEDPLILRGSGRYLDGPRLRYRRILVPALAYIGALGNPFNISAAYITVVVLFLGAGAYWLSRYASVAMSRSPWWGLAFVLAPAAFLSLDRLTVDIALAALTVAFALYWRTGQLRPLYAVLLLAPLAKETGFLLLAAYVSYEFFQKHWMRAVGMATAGIPAFLWLLYVQVHTPPDPTAWIHWPFSSVLDCILHPELLPQRPIYICVLDDLSWAGLVAAILVAVVRWRWNDPLSRAALMFALLASVIDLNVWQEVEGFGRAFTPLLILLPMSAPTRRAFLPLALLLPRALVFPAVESFKALLHCARHFGIS